MPESGGSPKATRIGGYEILGRLGQGGMGAVYKARQVSMNRIVALKVLPPRLAKDKAFVQRFIREAQSAAALQHSNIVQGIDVGVADGYYYFAMEFVDGPTVKQLVLNEGALDEKRALGIARSVAVALAHAHEHGIIHRDIKPSNILLTAKGQTKLADLGLARRVEEAGAVTLEGTALGTPYCMAPEQVRGLPDIDIRADIYALGATLHYLLTAAFPFDGPTASAIMTKHVTDPVPSAHDTHPHVSRACGDLIARMMAKAPNDRPQTPTDLLSDIDDALAGKVTLRPGPRSKTRTLASARKHPKPRAAPPNVGGVGARAEAPRGLPRVLPKKKATPWIFAGIGALLLAIIVVWLSTRGDGPPKPPPADPAQLALQQADAYAKQHPTDYDGAIARYQAVASQHGGSQWASIAAGRVDELRKRKAGATATTKASKELEAAIAKLKADARALASKDRFGDALKAIDAFAAKHKQQVATDAVAAIRRDILATAGTRFDTLADAADDAKGQGDYAKARATLKPALDFGIPGLVDAARGKLAAYDAEEKNAEHLAKWDALKAQAAKLVEAGKYGDALKLLDTAKAIPLDDIADRIADETALIEDAQRDLLEKARAAYAIESDKVWTAFKARKYADADRLLAALAKRPEFAVGGVSTPREGNPATWGHAAHNMLAADQQAAALLRAFWAAVAEGLKLKTGTFLAFAGAGGNIASVKDGKVTLRTPRGEQVTLPLTRLDAKRALANALLKNDARSKLIEAIFLLAEAADPAAAAQALAAVGDAPGLSHYRDRLDALRLGAAEHAARRAWGRIQRLAGGRPTDAALERLGALLDAYERDHGDTQHARQVIDAIAALRARAKTSAWAGPFGAVGQRIEKTTTVGHCGQLWRITEPHPAGTRYRVRIQHAAPGDKGAFRIWAWADASGDGVPDTRIGISEIRRARKAGDWSTWEFQTRHTAVFVGDLFPPGTVIYYHTAGSLYTGLSSTLYHAVALTDRPQKRAEGPRFTNLHVTTKAPPARVAAPGEWQSLFDGKSLGHWRAVKQFPQEPGALRRGGEAHVKNGRIVLERGNACSAIAWTGKFPTVDYEISMESMRVAGGMNFGDLIFPIGKSRCRFLLGGSVAGNCFQLDRLDGRLGAGNPTHSKMAIALGRWYRIRLRVTAARIQAWLDDRQIIDLATAGHTFKAMSVYAPVTPFGIATWETKAAYRNIRLRRLAPEAEPRDAAPEAGEWHGLLEGKALRGWRRVTRFPVNPQWGPQEGGTVKIADGTATLDAGDGIAGLVWSGKMPTADYEIELEARRASGLAFCLVTFPIGESHCSLTVGTHDGKVVGLDLVDGQSDDKNQAASRMDFENDRWYRIRLRVTRAAVAAWIDGKRMFELPTAGRRFTTWGALRDCRPLAVTAVKARSSLRNLRLRRLAPAGG